CAPPSVRAWRPTTRPRERSSCASKPTIRSWCSDPTWWSMLRYPPAFGPGWSCPPALSSVQVRAKQFSCNAAMVPSKRGRWSPAGRLRPRSRSHTACAKVKRSSPPATSSSIRKDASVRAPPASNDQPDHRFFGATSPPDRRGRGIRRAPGLACAQALPARRAAGARRHPGDHPLRLGPSPEVIDAQVTYPIVSSLLGAPRVKSVRGISDLGSSFVYVTFEEGTDLYWARSRIIEYLATIQPRLPEDVRVELGPDATALGWVFQYALVDRSGTHQPDELRSYQDWYLKYYLKAIPGVADVATVGGFVRQYQINLDPNRLRAYGISTKQVVAALRGSNNEATGKVVDSGGAEFIVRGLGYAHNTADLENILVATAPDGTPYRIKDLGHVAIGSDFRRGVADLDGEGGTVSGIVIMRQGQNALEVIDRVKQRLRQLEPSLPKGVEVVAVYDRSDFVRRSIDNLNTTIVEVMLTVAIVILVFLWHPPSASVPLLTIPFAVLIAFVPFQMLGLSANIMSLGGIAIAIGAMVDASIVMVEQTHKKLEEWDRLGRPTEASSIVLRAVKQVARPSFFALI